MLHIVTDLGAAPFIALVAAIVVAITSARRQWRMVRAWVVALAGTGISVEVLKLVVHRVRPAHATPGLGDSTWSFPSGHAALAAVTYGLLAYWMMKSTRTLAVRAVIAGVAMIVIGGIAYSRLALGEHYLSDVIGGLVVGGIWAVLGAIVGTGTLTV